jgi:hypothetical protein
MSADCVGQYPTAKFKAASLVSEDVFVLPNKLLVRV